ncbi:MAG: hypothetical protein EXS38_00850 [Opitutus sp.]|nr:hypothetical protein [Opitutus sp.]
MHTPKTYSVALFGLALTAAVLSAAQSETPRATPAPAAKKEKADPAAQFNRPQAPATMPGKGLAQHDFILMGVRSSSDGKGIRMVKGGQVVWSYVDPEVKGAYYDATMLANGNLLLAHGRGVRIITPDKKVVWKYEVDPNEHEIDGAEAVGSDRVVFLMNGSPTARIMVANIVTGKIEKEVEVPLAATANTKEPRYVHMQARRMRLTPSGTALIAYTNANKVSEYDENGKEVWTASVPSPWSVERLKNGNTLVESMKMETIELNPKGETVWKFTKDDAAAQGYLMDKTQAAMRLPNGNTLITVNNETAWKPGTSGPDAWAPAQAIEVTPEKKIVWALRDWNNFYWVSTMQTLDDPRIKEKLHFGSVR